MSRIAFSGYYGMSNYGDDLFGVAAHIGARAYWAHHDCRIISPPIDGLAATYGYPRAIPRSWFEAHNSFGSVVRLCSLLGNSLFADRIVFAGGSIFTSSRTSNRRLLLAARRNGLAFSAIGVSIGPFETAEDERGVRQLLRHFDYVSVRDQSSYEHLLSFGLDADVVQSADLAGIVAHQRKRCSGVTEANVTRIGFSPCFMLRNPALAKSYCEHFVAAVRNKFSSEHVKIEVICLNQHYKVGDIGLCGYVMQALSDQGYDCNLTRYRDLGVLGTWDYISGLDAYFSVRLHGAITAYLSGVPFFLYEYHEKCADFLDFIGKDSEGRVKSDDVHFTAFYEAFESITSGDNLPKLHANDFIELSLANFLGAPMREAEERVISASVSE